MKLNISTIYGQITIKVNESDIVGNLSLPIVEGFWMYCKMLIITSEHSSNSTDGKYISDNTYQLNSSQHHKWSIMNHINNADTIKQRDKELFIKLDKYIKMNISNERLRVKDIAINVHTSIRKLQFKCKQLTGLTPLKILAHYRLHKAATLLCTTDRQIIHIVSDSGFAEISSFHRSFKRYFLMTPAEYRKKYS